MKHVSTVLIMIFLFSQVTWGQPKTALDTLREAADSLKREIVKKDAAIANAAIIDTVRFQYTVKKGNALQVTLDTAKASSAKNNCDCLPYSKPESLDKTSGLLTFFPLLIFVFIVIPIILIKTKEFNLKGALAENDQPKKIIVNPAYSSATIKDLASIPNISMLLPPTIEVSDWGLSIANLKLLADEKKAAATSAQTTAATAKTAADAAPADTALKAAYESAKKEADALTKEADAAKYELTIAEDAAKNKNLPEYNYRPSISRYMAFITSLVTIVIVICLSCFYMFKYITTGCPPDFSPLTVVLIALGIGVTPYITNKIATAATTNKS